ncbi:MAG TPA: helix-turn-helix domain-containing protein [Candidatus Cybelea sp.]|nr:helix-turn-helix domain-containing protein [Candidatus Cybelea sp.]
MPCPIARTLDLVGEWWTLLLIRDALLGARRFEDFKKTGIAENILTVRLKKLTEAGIFERRLYQSRPDRYEYALTERGRELAPVVFALRAWGRRWTEGADQSEIRHADCGGDVVLGFHCTKCDRQLRKTEIAIAPRPQNPSKNLKANMKRERRSKRPASTR